MEGNVPVWKMTFVFVLLTVGGIGCRHTISPVPIVVKDYRIAPQPTKLQAELQSPGVEQNTEINRPEESAPLSRSRSLTKEGSERPVHPGKPGTTRDPVQQRVSGSSGEPRDTPRDPLVKEARTALEQARDRKSELLIQQSDAQQRTKKLRELYDEAEVIERKLKQYRLSPRSHPDTSLQD